MKLTKGILVAAAMTFVPAVAYAASPSTTFGVKMSIGTGCTTYITAGSDIDFGTEAVLDSNFDGTTTLSVQCSQNTPFDIGLDAGTNSSDVGARKMSNGTDTISYFLYRDAARSLNWGETTGTGGDTFHSDAASGDVETVTVYGRVPPQSTPQAGDYTDTVTATFTY